VAPRAKFAMHSQIAKTAYNLMSASVIINFLNIIWIAIIRLLKYIWDICIKINQGWM